MPAREAMQRLRDEVRAAYQVRAEAVAGIRTATETLLRESLQERRTTAQKQAGLRANVGAHLQELKQERQSRAHAVRRSLGQARSQLGQGERQRKSQVGAWLRELAAEYAGAHQAWHAVAASIQTQRAGSAAGGKASVSSVPEEQAPDTPLQEAEGESGPGGEGGVGEGAEELLALGKRVLQYLAGRPVGARLTDIQAAFGLGRFQATRVVKHLMDANQVEKQDLTYRARP